MGGKSKKKTTSTYTPPEWVEDTAQQAHSIGRRIGSKRYSAYEGDRVAGLSEDEQRGMALARKSVGIAQPYIDKASALTERGTQQFADADMSQYMNPYIENALDPAAREIRESGLREQQALQGKAASMSAFGGSRAALMQGQAAERTTQELGDLYGEGYARAYESATSMWGQERARDLEAAGRFQMLGGAAQDAAQTDISTLMTVGATDRGIQQAMKDFDYRQWIEERDWDFRQLAGVIAALEGTKGSYTTTQTTKEEVKKDHTAEVVGAIAQIVSSAYMSGSDVKLKDNIRFLCEFMGHRLYTWTWNALAVSLGINTPTIGVIAQEVIHTGCVARHPDDYLVVNYRRLFGE